MAHGHGETWHKAKLTDPQARQLIADRETLCSCGRQPSYETLGKRYGITAVAVCKIVSGQSWKHLRETPA